MSEYQSKYTSEEIDDGIDKLESNLNSQIESLKSRDSAAIMPWDESGQKWVQENEV